MQFMTGVGLHYMREYAKVAPQFWIGDTGKKLRTLGAESQVVAFYLITSPHANMLGLYYLPMPLLAHETGLSLQGASKALQRVCEAGFAAYDAPSEWIWVYEMARFQIADALKENDNRVVGINREYQTLPNNPFLKEFYLKYASAFHLEIMRGSQGAPKGLRSQEQEQEQEQERENTPQPPLRVISPMATSVVDQPLKAKASRFMPSSFVITEELRQWAREDVPGVDIDSETKTMRDWEFKDPHSDWTKAWRNWMRRAWKKLPPHARTNTPHSGRLIL